MNKEADQLLKESHKALKEVFRNQINVNFMIEVMHEVFKSHPEIEKYYHPFAFDISSALKMEWDHASFYEVCLHIIYIHRSNVIFKSDEERKKIETSGEYHQYLVDKVVQQVKLRDHVYGLLLRKPLSQGDRFIYTPVLFDLAVILSKCGEYLVPLNKSKFSLMYLGVYTDALTTISLLNDNLFASAYPHARAALESSIKLAVLKLNPLSIDAFLELNQLDLERSLGHSDNKKNRELFESRINKSDKSLSNYLHFGWVDTIKNYHSIVTSKPYSIEGLITYLQATVDENYEKLTYYYKLCHGYVHGTNLGSIYPIIHYFELTIILVNVISDLYGFMTSELNIDDISIDNIDVAKDTAEEYKKLVKCYEERTTEKLKEYYKKYFPGRNG